MWPEGSTNQGDFGDFSQGIVGQGPGKEFGEDWSWWSWMGTWRRGTYPLYSQIP